jgi:hypothetical protein
MRMCHPLAPTRVLPLPCPPTLKGASRRRPKVFSSRPFFLVRSMSRAPLTPLPLVLVPPPKCHRSHRNRSHRRLDLCLIGERRLRAVSRPNGFALTSPAPLRCCICLPPPPPTIGARCHRDTPLSHRSKPPCRRPTGPVIPTLPHLVRRVPCAAPMLVLPSPPHLVRR